MLWASIILPQVLNLMKLVLLTYLSYQAWLEKVYGPTFFGFQICRYGTTNKQADVIIWQFSQYVKNHPTGNSSF